MNSESIRFRLEEGLMASADCVVTWKRWIRDFRLSLPYCIFAGMLVACGGGGDGGSILPGSRGVSTAVLSWDAVSSSDLAGYHVYFGTASGQYSQPLRQGIDAGNITTYTVPALNIGTRYYFVVTAYDAAGHESDFSNEVSKIII